MHPNFTGAAAAQQVSEGAGSFSLLGLIAGCLIIGIAFVASRFY